MPTGGDDRTPLDDDVPMFQIWSGDNEYKTVLYADRHIADNEDDAVLYEDRHHGDNEDEAVLYKDRHYGYNEDDAVRYADHHEEQYDGYEGDGDYCASRLGTCITPIDDAYERKVRLSHEAVVWGTRTT